MKQVVTCQEMKSCDSYTIEKMGVPSCVLMERAALKVVEELEKRFTTENIKQKILCVCGSGNNGGDGFAVARLLAEKGCHVDVLFTGRESSMTEECRLQAQIDKNLGINLFTEIPEKEYTVIIDAIFGVGLSRKVEGKYKDAIEYINNQRAKVYAVDMPSGIDGSTGEVLGVAIKADYTVTFGFHKVGSVPAPV